MSLITEDNPYYSYTLLGYEAVNKTENFPQVENRIIPCTGAMTFICLLKITRQFWEEPAGIYKMIDQTLTWGPRIQVCNIAILYLKGLI